MTTQHETRLPDGVFAATLTPQNEDLQIDHERMITHCQWLLANGCQGLTIMGTTGEANSFSVKERMNVLDALVKGGIPPHVMMVGTGCCALTDTVDLTWHALEHEVGGILLLPPFYYKQVSDEGVFRAIDEVIQEVGEDDLQVYLYHFPQMSAVPFSLEVIDRLLDRYPDTVVGMKDSSGDWAHMQLIMEEFPELRLYAGTEKYLLNVLLIGGVGCISATTNVTCALADKVVQHWRAEHVAQAQELQNRLTAIRETFEDHPFIGALKSFFAHTCNDKRWLAMRPPNVPLSEAESEALNAALNDLQFTLNYPE